MVMHADRHGEMHRYSSKPPLLPTLLAGEYWLIYHLTGATLGTHPYDIGRFMLVTFNVLPLLVYFVLLGKLADRFGGTEWGRMFMMAGAAFGTLLTTFAVVLNNHLPAAVSAVVALYAAVRIWFDGERRWRYFIVAGLFAAFAAANELPALAFLGLLGLALLWKAPKQTLLAGTPAVLLVAAAFFATNKIAHDSWRPPYMHRSPGDNWYDYEYVDSHNRRRESYWRSANKVGLDVGEPSLATYAFHATFGHHGIFSLTPIWLLSVAGLWLFWRSGQPGTRALAFLIASLSLICLTFYLLRPLEDRNYGGMSSGFRWMFWFAPLWLVALLPCADWMGRRRWGKAAALVLLAASAMSAAYPTWNPWTYPWIQNWMQSMGWLDLT